MTNVTEQINTGYTMLSYICYAQNHK